MHFLTSEGQCLIIFSVKQYHKLLHFSAKSVKLIDQHDPLIYSNKAGAGYNRLKGCIHF